MHLCVLIRFPKARGQMVCEIRRPPKVGIFCRLAESQSGKNCRGRRLGADTPNFRVPLGTGGATAEPQ